MSQGWDDEIDALRRRKREALRMGGDAAIARVHQRGKLTARERVAQLLDPGSFREIGLLAEGVVETPGQAAQTVPADGVVTGWGEIEGRRVLVMADDGSIMGGAAGLLNIEKRFRIRRMALEQGYPLVGLYEGSAIRFQDSMDAGVMMRAPAFKEVSDCHGVIPQVAAILGPCFGRPPFDVLFSDFAAMVKGTGFLGLSGPALVQGGIGEATDIDALSGPDMHARTTGLIDFVAESEAACLGAIRAFLSFMPASAWEEPPVTTTNDDRSRSCDELLEIVPANVRKPYNMRRVIRSVVDDGACFEYKAEFGKSLITALARLNGRVVGVVGSQPSQRGGVMDAAAGLKARRFVSVCDQFHIPLVFLQDQPGFLPGKDSEAANILFWGGSFLAAVQRATVPKLTVILRKAHGAALWAMGVGGEYGEAADLVASWPGAIMTGTGPASAVYTVHAKELKAAYNPEALRRELEARYSMTGSVYRAAARFGVHDVIEPPETRRWLIDSLEMACGKIRRQLQPKRPLFP